MATYFFETITDAQATAYAELGYGANPHRDWWRPTSSAAPPPRKSAALKLKRRIKL